MFATARASARAAWVCVGLLTAVSVGVLGRGFWTPDEPREADIAWRMSWQSNRAVPLLATEPFCEKPPFTYWSAAVPMRLLGPTAWSARLPNLLYAFITALAVAGIARRSVGTFAAWVGAAAITTFLLSYQVEIWLGTDAPLLAFVSAALYGMHVGWYAVERRARLLGYLLMHSALGLGFLSKSGAAWLVPALAFVTLGTWERRWRDLFRWELHIGLLLQALIILPWVWAVWSSPDGMAHLKVFFWNNLVGRFARVDAPSDLQYTSGHQNSLGKYLVELPVYLFPWTLLFLAALRRAWQHRRIDRSNGRAVRFALAAFVPSIAVLSCAATARNIYLAPALPGAAILLAWWANSVGPRPGRWDLAALRGTALLLAASAAALSLAAGLTAIDTRSVAAALVEQSVLAATGVIGAIGLSSYGWRAANTNACSALWALLLSYGCLLIGPCASIYRSVDRWQDLSRTGVAVAARVGGAPVILLAPDETTRAFVDMFTSTAASIAVDAASARSAAVAQHGFVLVQVPGRTPPQEPRLAGYFERQSRQAAEQQLRQDETLHAAALEVLQVYALPNGRRYALLIPKL